MAEVTDESERKRRPLSEPVPLTAEHDLSAFDCGEAVLNDWLRQRALRNESRFSRTYVVCEGNRVIAYVGVRRDGFDGAVRVVKDLVAEKGRTHVSRHTR